jgi:hypothetical protein
MIERIALGGLLVAALAVGAAGTATAEEVRQQLNAPMILNLLARPLEAPEVAFNQALKKDAGAPRAARGDEPVVLPDGSLRYGRAAGLSVTIRNPCPPGDIEHEVSYERPLPGRARR